MSGQTQLRGQRAVSVGAKLARLLAAWWPLLLVAAASVLVYVSGAYRYVSLQAISERQAELRQLAAMHPTEAAAALVAATTVFLLLSLPGEGVLTIIGGLLFGTLVGTALSVMGTVIAAVLLFLGLRRALSVHLARKRGPRFERIRERMAADEVNYLLMLRLLPVLPFSLVSLLAVLVRMRLTTFALTTTIGAIPPTFIFAAVGNGLRQLLTEHETVTLEMVWSPRLMLPLLGLALLAVLPVGWRYWRRHVTRRVAAE